MNVNNGEKQHLNGGGGGKLLHTETPLPGANQPTCRLMQDVDLFTGEVFSHKKNNGNIYEKDGRKLILFWYRHPRGIKALLYLQWKWN